MARTRTLERTLARRRPDTGELLRSTLIFCLSSKRCSSGRVSAAAGLRSGFARWFAVFLTRTSLCGSAQKKTFGFATESGLALKRARAGEVPLLLETGGLLG